MEIQDKDKRRLALLVIDVQKKFAVDKKKAFRFDDHIQTINTVTKMFREAGRPVIFIKYEGQSHSHPEMGPEGDDFFDEIETAPTDITVSKIHMNSFRETDLADIIKEKGCDNVLIAGMITHYCVMSTYFGAFDKGLIPFLMEGACISSDEEINDAAEILCKTYSLEELKENLSALSALDL